MSNNPINHPIGNKHTEQNISNKTDDEDFKVISIELLAYDATNNVLRRVKCDENGIVQTI